MLSNLIKRQSLGNRFLLKMLASGLLLVTAVASANDAPPCIDKRVQAMVFSQVGASIGKKLATNFSKEDEKTLSLEAVVPTGYDTTIKKRGCSANILYRTDPGYMPGLRKQVAIYAAPGVMQRAAVLRSLARDDPAEANAIFQNIQTLNVFKDAPFMATPDGGNIAQNIKYAVQFQEDGKNLIVTVDGFVGDVDSFFSVLKSCLSLNNLSAKARALLLP